MIHFLGSDVHRTKTIYTKMPEIKQELQKVLERDKLKKLTKINPQLVLDNETIYTYITHLENAFIFETAKRFNIKGKAYVNTPNKYYPEDIGLRNARLNFRQQDDGFGIEAIVYNELRCRGYLVDVGVVEVREMKDGKQQQTQYEVDFIATNGQDKYYIQSAYRISDEVKREQELQSLKRIDDSFRKIVIVYEDIASWTNEDGIIFMGMFEFLQNGLPR